jgi:hypothetical protein
MTHSPEQMRQKAHAKANAEYHHMNGSVAGMKVQHETEAKPSPKHSVKPNMDHNRTGLGLQQEDNDG